MTTNLSIIIPVLNERECLPRTLASLAEQKSLHQVVVVDGGSNDGSREWLRVQPLVQLLDTAAGKGNQLNAGARAATGDTLLFLHADCLLPRDAAERIAHTLKTQSVAGGCFHVSFAEKRPATLRFVAGGVNLRSNIFRTATGDQAIFVRRDVFQKFGGVPDWPLFEDVELVRRIKRAGRFVVVPRAVTISARRYLSCGIFKTALLMFALRVGFWIGIPVLTLKRWFKDVRPHLESQPSTLPPKGTHMT